MTEPEPDPRTDGVGDGGMTELLPPPEGEIAAGVELDLAIRELAISDIEGFGP